MEGGGRRNGEKDGGRDSPAEEVRMLGRSRGSGRERGCAAWAGRRRVRAAPRLRGLQAGGGRVLAATQSRPRARGAPAAARAAWLRDPCAAMARSRRSWAQLLLLLLAGPAACAASPADDGAGPGGRGPRGRARGDSSADETVPRHDSSYGTFAGEFYDLRYLSEEGYPFPTAPPVDPFAKIKVDDCGKTKGCFRYGKPGCNAETCDYFLSYRMIGADVEFELSADTDGWVAVGFSSDKKMGGDDVMACVHDDNGRVRIQHFYNVGQWAKEIQRNPARDEEGVFENNRVTCRFKRPVNVPRDETIVDLHLSWYYLFAWGPAIQECPDHLEEQMQLLHMPYSPRCADMLEQSGSRSINNTFLRLVYQILFCKNYAFK